MSGREDRTGEEEQADTEEDTNRNLTAEDISNHFLLSKIKLTCNRFVNAEFSTRT